MEKSQITPIFSTDASLGKSILTSDDAKDEITEDAPISIWSIAKYHKLDTVCVVENSFVSFVAHYKQSLKTKKKFIFGVKMKIAANAADISAESFDTESDVIIWLKNSNGYQDLINLFSRINGRPEYYIWDKFQMKWYGRGDWALLKDNWTDNLLLSIPFYDSFLHRNLLEYNHRAIPEFGYIKPVFHIESHELPFDYLIKDSVLNYCNSNKLETINTHTILYYTNEDAKAFQVAKCIANRTTCEMPNLPYFSQPTFSFESYIERINGK